MSRSTLVVLGMLGVAALAVVIGTLLRSNASDGPVSSEPPLADYHASDPSLIASTARPQLLEFFHPQ